MCKDPQAANSVDICVMSFCDLIKVLQDWCPITKMKHLELSGCGTNMSEGFRTAVDMLRECGHFCKDNGIEVRMLLMKRR